MRDNSANVLFILITLTIQVVNADTTCLTQIQLAAIVFGIALGTLILAFTIAFILWRFARNRRTDESIIIVEKATEKAAYENGALEVEHKATEPMPPQLIDKTTSCHSLKQYHRLKNIQRLQSQRSRSPESAAKLKEMVQMALESRDITPLGFDIQQSRDCIFIESVKPNGPADKSGNVFVGDRIKALSVSFEGMLLEDAIGILSCAAPYKMKLELERALIEDDEKHLEGNIMIDEYFDINTQPPFRSISLNSLSSNSSGEKRTRGGSWMSKQKYALPRDVKHSDSVSPASTAPADSLPDSHHDTSSSTVSIPTDSSSTMMPISMIIEKNSTPPNSEIEFPPMRKFTPPALPTSPPPNLSPNSPPKTPIIPPSTIEKLPSSKIPIVAPSPTPKISRLPVPKYSPKLAFKIEEIQRNGIEEFVEVSHFTFSKPTLSTKRSEQVEFCEHLEPKRKSIVVEFKENHQKNALNDALANHNVTIENEEEFFEILRLERELTPVEMPPRIVGMKVEKITSTPQTSPIIERKLPPLPKMIDIPIKDERNAAALYIEQKDALRKTFVPPKTNENGIILGQEQKARLEANRSILERQEEELRALGVLP